MLHIVNGDSVGDKLKQAGLDGEVLVWRDIYTEGPVFLQPESGDNRVARGSYLEQKLGIPLQQWLHGAEEQEQRLAGLGRYSEIILWFEHDLFDQTMLCRLLHSLAGHNLAGTKLQLLSIGEYPGIEVFHGLGQLSVEQLAGLAGTWQELSEEQLLLGKRAWEAYTAATPEPLVRLLQEDTSALPFLHDAFLLHLNRFPSVQNGLGIIQQTTLELLLAGVDRPMELFRQASDRLNALGMGDLQYWAALRTLAQSEHPLIVLEGADGDAGTAAFPGLHDDPELFLSQRITLTELGIQLAERRADWVSLNGVDEWLGGVRLAGKQDIWRWDRESGSIVRSN